MPLEDYKEHFEGWLKDLKKTGGYWPIVERHEYNWSNIYSDLNRLFKDEVWNHVLEQRARERDHDRIIPSAQTFHGRMPVKSTENIAKSTEDRFYRDLRRDVQIIFHCFETQNSLTHLGHVNELIR